MFYSLSTETRNSQNQEDFYELSVTSVFPCLDEEIEIPQTFVVG
jgi:hypothetical protein